MKKILFLCFLFLCVTLHADQLEWISLEQAKKAKTFLETQTEIIEYHACDDNPSYKTLKINQVEYRHTGTENYYQIYLLGKNEEEKDEEWATDLAYLYFKEQGNAQNVGKYLNFECDPCAEPFEWGKNPIDAKMPDISGEWKNYLDEKFETHFVGLQLFMEGEGRVSGSVETRNFASKQKYGNYILEGNISKEGIAHLEVIVRNRKGSFSLGWVKLTLQGETLQWERESGDEKIFPNSTSLERPD